MDTPKYGHEEGQDPDGKDAALSLMAAIVDQNVTNLAWTNDRIIEGLESDILRIGEVLADVVNIIDDADVIDRRTLRRLALEDGRIALALETVRRKKESH